MSRSRTTFDRVELLEADKAAVHHIDQFWWFSEGMSNAEEELSRASAIDFNIPFGGRLTIVGEPTECKFDGYFVGPRRKGDSRVWEVFKYDCDRFKDRITGLKREPIEGYNCGMFTTSIDPFLHTGGIPHDFERRYEIPLLGSDHLEIIAKRGAEAKDDKLMLVAHPDARGAEPYEIVSFFIRNGKWFSRSLNMD